MNRKTPVAATGKYCRQLAVTVKITGNRRFTAGKVNTGPASSYARRRGARLPMPSPPKERPSDCLGHLLAALRPSLAKPASPPPSPTLSSRTMAASRSSLPYPPSAGSAAPPLRLRHPLPFPHRRRHPRRLRTSPPPSPDAVDVSLSDQPVRPARRGKGGGFGLGLGFLAFSSVVSLAPLMI